MTRWINRTHARARFERWDFRVSNAILPQGTHLSGKIAPLSVTPYTALLVGEEANPWTAEPVQSLALPRKTDRHAALRLPTH